MDNPWNGIDLEDYEKHMGAENVLQLQALSRITSEQLAYRVPRVAILGAAGGNGLEHVDTAVVKKVYAIDINARYLDACRIRHACLGDVLETVQCDLAEPGVTLPYVDLAICNLIVEYVGTKRFAEAMRANSGTIGMLSCVIQKNNGMSFVSASDAAKKLECLESLHRDIGEGELTEELAHAGFKQILRKSYALTNAKEFIRLDFENRQNLP